MMEIPQNCCNQHQEGVACLTGFNSGLNLTSHETPSPSMPARHPKGMPDTYAVLSTAALIDRLGSSYGLADWVWGLEARA